MKAEKGFPNSLFNELLKIKGINHGLCFLIFVVGSRTKLWV